MSAPTASKRYLLAAAAVRAVGLMHVVSQRDTGALNPVCAANPVRSAEIHTWTTAPADLDKLCADCAEILLNTPGVDSIEQGLAVWIGGGSPAARTRLLEVPLSAIALDGDRARRGEGTLAALAESIAEHGVIQPVVVRPTGAGYELVVGARRLAAARLAGLTTVPALVRDVDDEQAILAALTENLHRADLNPIDEAHAYQHALAVLELKQHQLAVRLAISQAQVSNTMRLLKLPAEVQDLVASGAVGAAHARELLKLDDDAAMVALAAQVAAEGLTVKETAARRGAPTPAAPRADFSQLLADLRDARMLVTMKAGGRARITIDVLETDLDGLLKQLGHTAALAAA